VAGPLLGFIRPLLKWRILDVQTLWAENGVYKGNYANFHKALQRMEKWRVIVSTKNPWTRKKYIFLSDVGAKMVGKDQAAFLLNKDTWGHDARVRRLSGTFIVGMFFKNSS